VANHVIFSLKLNTSKSIVHMKLTCDWNIHCWTADTVYKRLMTEIEDHNADRPILSSDKFIFSRTIAFSNIWKTMCYSCTYLIIIASEMIFYSFFLHFFFQAIFIPPYSDRVYYVMALSVRRPSEIVQTITPDPCCRFQQYFTWLLPWT
jgi:hypothetical protein